jgi:hypothetical protein
VRGEAPGSLTTSNDFYKAHFFGFFDILSSLIKDFCVFLNVQDPDAYGLPVVVSEVPAYHLHIFHPITDVDRIRTPVAFSMTLRISVRSRIVTLFLPIK